MKCHVKGCRNPVICATRIPTEDHKSTELWYYCEEHSVFADINEAIENNLDEIVSKAVDDLEAILGRKLRKYK